MLVLTRRPGESIVIGNGIKLTVVNVGPGRVKIGIEAPPSVRVDRSEIHDRIQQEKASDVLEAVSAQSLGMTADQPTFISAGPETDVMHAAPVVNQPRPIPPATEAGSEVTGIRKYRAPRKPR